MIVRKSMPSLSDSNIYSAPKELPTKFGNKSSGNRACDIPVVKPHPIAFSSHLTFI